MAAAQTYTLRRPTPAERAQVAGLVADAGLPTRGLDALTDDHLVVAEHDGRIVGVAAVERHGAHGLLRSVAVDPAWRGRGLGRALTQERAEWAAGAGLSALYLLTTTAGGYFPRLGFVPVVRDHVPPEVRASDEFADICPANATVMCLPLGRKAEYREGVMR